VFSKYIGGKNPTLPLKQNNAVHCLLVGVPWQINEYLNLVSKRKKNGLFSKEWPKVKPECHFGINKSKRI